MAQLVAEVIEDLSKPVHDLQDVADCLYEYQICNDTEFLQEVLLDDGQRDKLIKCIDYNLTGDFNEESPCDASIFKISSIIVDSFSSDFIEVLKDILMSESDSSTVSSLLGELNENSFHPFDDDSYDPE